MVGGLEPKGRHEGEVITKSGERRIIAWHNTALKDENGQTIGSLSSGEDITDLKQAEAEAKHLNLVLRAIRNVNQLITREKDCDRLLRDICLALVETRGYYSVRISLVDEAGRLAPAMEASLDETTKATTARLGHGEITPCQRQAQQQKDVACHPQPADGLPHLPHGRELRRLQRAGRPAGARAPDIRRAFRLRAPQPVSNTKRK